MIDRMGLLMRWKMMQKKKEGHNIIGTPKRQSFFLGGESQKSTLRSHFRQPDKDGW